MMMINPYRDKRDMCLMPATGIWHLPKGSRPGGNPAVVGGKSGQFCRIYPRTTLASCRPLEPRCPYDKLETSNLHGGRMCTSTKMSVAESGGSTLPSGVAAPMRLLAGNRNARLELINLPVALMDSRERQRVRAGVIPGCPVDQGLLNPK